MLTANFSQKKLFTLNNCFHRAAPPSYPYFLHTTKQNQMEKNFNNLQFKWTFESISDNIPTIMLLTIVLTYGINAYLTAIFLPIDFWLAIIAASILQLGRFAVVFMDFLNPTKGRSTYPPKIALGATLVALVEIFFGLQEKYEGGEFITMFLFVGTIVVFGYLLEINFVDKGVEAYGINAPEPKPKRKRKPRVKVEAKATEENTGTTAKNFVSSFKTITL